MIQECKGTSSTDNEQELPILKSVERGKSAPIKPKLQLQNDQRHLTLRIMYFLLLREIYEIKF